VWKEQMDENAKLNKLLAEQTLDTALASLSSK
jgi:hypothetical protein